MQTLEQKIERYNLLCREIRETEEEIHFMEMEADKLYDEITELGGEV